MYTFGSAINRQGAITIPRTPVIRPPVRKLISLGRAFEKSYEGLTMLAATLTDRVATASVKSAKTTTSGLSNFPVSVTGSQMGAPYTFCVAAVISTATRGNSVMVVGRPSTWPSAWARWLLPNRVKSGMLSDSVDQNAIIPISAGGNSTNQKLLPQPTLPGSLRIGPKPPALPTIQASSPSATISTNGAAQFSNRRTAFIPRRMMKMLIAQKIAKLSHRRQVGVVERAVANRRIVGQLVSAVWIDELLPDSLRRRCVGRYSHVPLLEFAVAVLRAKCTVGERLSQWRFGAYTRGRCPPACCSRWS